jgi:hypothetical protein
MNITSSEWTISQFHFIQDIIFFIPDWVMIILWYAGTNIFVTISLCLIHSLMLQNANFLCTQHQIIFPADIPIPKVQSFNHLWNVIEILYKHECLVLCYSHPVVKFWNHLLILQGECKHELWFHLHICLSNIIFWEHWLFSEFTLWRDGLPFSRCSLVRLAQEVHLKMLTVKGCLCCISRASAELMLHNKLRRIDFEWFFHYSD